MAAAQYAAEYCISAASVAEAASRIGAAIHHTPTLTSAALDHLVSAAHGREIRVTFKCENFQKTGSFKARGAANAVLSLPGDCSAVCTHSSGNHAQALAWAASLRRLTPHIVMPRGAPVSKVEAVQAYGGRVIECEPTQAAREAAAAAVAAEAGAAFIHPSEDPRVIAGQGTVGLELLEQGRNAAEDADGSPVLDMVVVPVGGGGLISGVATAVKAADERITVVGAEPAAADDAFRSKREGSIQKNATPPATIADGLKTTLGPNTWPIVRDKVDSIVTVEEGEIRAALRLLYGRLKVVLEPSAAVGLAALLSDKCKPVLAAVLPAADRPIRVAVVLCGGNLDLDKLHEYIAP